MSRAARWLGLAVLGGSAIAGCAAPFETYRVDIQTQLRDGRYDLIEASLDRRDHELKRRTGDELLWMLDRGTVALARDDADTTIEVLNDAETRMAVRRRLDPAEVLLAAVGNETWGPYLGEPYEEVYVNVLKMLAHLEAGQIQGAATVEARRLATKVDLLRDEYLATERAVNDLHRRGSPVAVPSPGSGGHFIESPLGTYLTAVAFMHVGDRASQAVAGRRLAESIDVQRGLIGDVDARNFAGIGSRAPSASNVLLVALSGQGPFKTPVEVGPVMVHDAPIYFELPMLERNASEVQTVRALVGSARRDRTRRVDLALIEDFGAVAHENHRQQLPLVYVRMLLRAASKSYAMHELNRAIADESPELADLGAAASMLFMTATEDADLRGWTTMPGQAHVSLLQLEPGEHRLGLEFVGRHGRVVHRSPAQTIEVPRRGMTTVVEGYWR